MPDERDARLNAILQKVQKQERESYIAFVLSVVEASEIIRELSPRERKLWLQHVLDEIFDEQQGLCAICGEPMEGNYEVDHKVPFRHGGGHERSNLQLVHQLCNRSKGKKVDPLELLKYLEDRYMNMNRQKRD